MTEFRLNQLSSGSKIIIVSFFILIFFGLSLSMNTASKTVKWRIEKAKTLGVKYDSFFDEDDKILHFKDAHVHLFGHSLIFITVASFFFFTNAKERNKVIAGVLMAITLIVHTYALINIIIPIEIVAMIIYTAILAYMMICSVIAMYKR